MKQYIGVVIVVVKGFVQEVTPFFDMKDAHQKFLDMCGLYISNFDEYELDDINRILNDETEGFGRGNISIHWFTERRK